LGSTKQTPLAGLGHVTVSGMPSGKWMSTSLFTYSYVHWWTVRACSRMCWVWHILCMLKISIAVLCISFQQWEPFKCGLNIFLVNFFLNFYFWNWWHLSDTQGWNFLLTLGLCVFVCVCVCVGLSERECTCRNVCACARALIICQLDIFKTIAVRLRSPMPNFNLLLHFKAESVKILKGFHIEYMYTILIIVVCLPPL